MDQSLVHGSRITQLHPEGTRQQLSATATDVVGQDSFRNYCRKLTAGVAVVTTGDPSGWAGTTISSVTSVSMNPPILLCCMDHRSRTLEQIRRSGLFAVNLLSADQRHLSVHFSRAISHESRFTGLVHEVHEIRGAPVLIGCVAVGLCSVHSVLDVGDHTVVFGLLVETEVHEGRLPLVYHDRAYPEIRPVFRPSSA